MQLIRVCRRSLREYSHCHRLLRMYKETRNTLFNTEHNLSLKIDLSICDIVWYSLPAGDLPMVDEDEDAEDGEGDLAAALSASQGESLVHGHLSGFPIYIAITGFTYPWRGDCTVTVLISDNRR